MIFVVRPVRKSVTRTVHGYVVSSKFTFEIPQKKMYTRTQKQLEHEEVQKWPMYVVFLLSIYIHIFTLHLNRRFVKLLLSGVKYVVWKHSQISTLEYIPTLENRYPRGQEILVAHMKDFLDKLNPILKVRDVSYLSHESKIKCTLERYSNTQVLDKVRYVSVCIVVFECAFRFVWDSVIQWEKKPRTRTHSSTTHVTHSNNTNTTHRIKTYQTIRINFRVVNCTSCYVFVPHRSMVTSIYYAIYSITRTTFDTQTQHRWLKAARTVRTIDLWCVLSDTIGVFSRIRFSNTILSYHWTRLCDQRLEHRYVIGCAESCLTRVQCTTRSIIRRRAVFPYSSIKLKFFE